MFDSDVSLRPRMRRLLIVLCILFLTVWIAVYAYAATLPSPEELNGWYSDSEGTRYLVNGVAQTQWQVIDGNTYYFDYGNGGYRLTGMQKLAGVYYEFDADGVLQTPDGYVGWFTDAGGTRYLQDGKPYSGWLELDGNTYYFFKTNDGYMATGTCVIAGQTYSFSEGGALEP